MTGLYIHFPFCENKCVYCDFYSIKYDETLAKKYIDRIISEVQNYDTTFDTIYFGGGTPSLMEKKQIEGILKSVRTNKNAEITLECNPSKKISDNDGFKTDFDVFFRKSVSEQSVLESGINRVSIGLQSANEDELAFLSRRHSASDVKKTVETAKNAGITNISLDIMIGLPNGSVDKLKKTIDFCIEMNAQHISAYILKIEEGTCLHKFKQNYNFPSEDEVAEQYIFLCEYLEKNRYMQYEISNFAKDGYKSKHNLIYWTGDEYYAAGAAAHSFISGKRGYYPRNIEAYIKGTQRIIESEKDDFETYFMLRMRLSDGYNFKEAEKRGYNTPQCLHKNAVLLEKAGLLIVDDEKISLTKQGFLVSNQIILKLLM